MNREIEALIVSAGEPQLERCLKAVKEQTVPFSAVTHINNMVPESRAFNLGMSLTVNEWVMKIDGDFILHDTAVAMVLDSMSDNGDDVYMYSYPLYDCFLKSNIFGCGVFRSPLFKQIKYPNMLANDLWAGSKLRRMGYRLVRPFGGDIPIGTHCEEPDEFQVFRRFFTRGVKGNNGAISRLLRRRLRESGDPLYQLALDAIAFGEQRKQYPSSHNIEFDKKMFKEFRAR